MERLLIQPPRAAATPHAARVARGFDRLSPCYAQLARLLSAGLIPASRTLLVGRVATARRALILGGGAGEFLIALLESGFDGTVVCLDISPGMLRRTRARLEKQRPHDEHRVELRCGEVHTLAGGDEFDLICTHYVLDLFGTDELERVMRRLDRALIAGGRWLCTDFLPPHGGVARRRLHGGLVRLLYGFFGLVCAIEPRCLPPIRATFGSLGYAPRVGRDLAGGLLWTALYQRADDTGSADPA